MSSWPRERAQPRPGAERSGGEPPTVPAGSGPRSISAEPSESACAPSPVARAEQFGRYRLCFELASGGMATVYLAHAGGPGRFQKHVALKRIHAHLASRRDFVEMFHDEAAIAARISHPNVAAVFDFGEEKGVHYLAMEYLLGEPLSRLLRACRRQPSIDRKVHARIVARIVADMCEGLHAAHELQDEQGRLLDVVHRDVSPDNVFVTYDGVVKLVDFGVASARNRITHTTTGVLKGKHAYMAPELLGDGGFDRRADLFSVGVVLWEALTLRRLFRRESEAKTLFAVVGDPIEAPSRVVPELDGALDAIVLRALARDPAERYATARELARDLRGYLLDQRADVTAADIEAWVARLSPDGLAQRRALLAGVDRIVAEDDAIPVELADEPARPAHVERTTRMPALGAAGVLVLAAAAVLAWSWSAQGTPSSEPELPRAEAGAPTAPSATPTATTAPSATPTAPAVTAVPSATPTATTTTATAPPPPIVPATSVNAAPPENAPPAPSAGRSQAASRPSVAAEPRRPRRSRSSAAPTGDPGELRVGLRARAGGSLPDDAWAQVRIDGRAVDGSPPMSLRLPPGRHVVEVRPYGQGPGVRRTVEIEPGGRAVAIFTIDSR